MPFPCDIESMCHRDLFTFQKAFVQVAYILYYHGVDLQTIK